jgi:hypothetical protein
MKRLLIILFSLQCCFSLNGQISTKLYKDGDALLYAKPIDPNIKTNKIVYLPPIDIQHLLDEDKIRMNDANDIPFRFGKAIDLNLTLDDGIWLDFEKGRIWSCEFKSKGAFSINFVFENLFLSDSALLYLTNSTNTILYGPVTSKQNKRTGFFLTDLIQGDDVILYLYEPNSQRGKSRLTIKKVVHAYKNMFPSFLYGNLNGSESCNNDIACFPALAEESDAVALVLLANGTEWCSGSLVMTSNQNFRPLFLSAFHCVDVDNYDIYDSHYGDGILQDDEISHAENWMFKFQYKMSTCSGSSATIGLTYNSAHLLAAWDQTDFVLMELDDSPVGNSALSWLGWDRSINTPASGTGIHHPSGDVMKISFDTNQFQTSSWGGANNHWLLSFDDGVVEHGSSGSPILNQNDRVVGQLHGNQTYNQFQTYCSQPRAEYGRFNISWTGGGTDSTRLSNWLDPIGIGNFTTNTSRSPYISGSNLICNSEYYLVNLLPQNYATSNWSSSPSGQYDIYSYGDSCEIINNFHVGTISLTATLVDTLTFNDTIHISKDINITYAPNYYTLYASLTTGGSSAWLQDYNCLLTYTFPGMYSGEINISDPAGYPIIENASWTILSEQNCSFANAAPSSDGKNVFLNFKPYGCIAVIRMTASNDCGSFYNDYTFRAGDNSLCSVQPERINTHPIITIYPNPTDGTVTIDYKADNQESGIEEVIVFNSLGAIINKKKYYSQKTITLNLSDQVSGIYFLELYDGTEWTCHQINIKK